MFSPLSRYSVSFRFLLYDFSSKIHCCTELLFAFSSTQMQMVTPLLWRCFSRLKLGVSCSSCGLQMLTRAKGNVQDAGPCPQHSTAQSSGDSQGLKRLLWVEEAWRVTCPLLPPSGVGAGSPQMPKFALQ